MFNPSVPLLLIASSRSLPLGSICKPELTVRAGKPIYGICEIFTNLELRLWGKPHSDLDRCEKMEPHRHGRKL